MVVDEWMRRICIT